MKYLQGLRTPRNSAISVPDKGSIRAHIPQRIRAVLTKIIPAIRTFISINMINRIQIKSI